MSGVGWVNSQLLDRRVYRPSEITDLQNIEAVENILGFYVTMDDAVAVEVSDAAGYLPEIVAGLVLWEVVLGPDLLE